MKIAFIAQGFEALAPEMLAAMAKREGHEFRLFVDPALFNDGFFQNDYLAKFFEERDRVVERIVKWGPDLVAFSVLSDTYPWAHDMAGRVKKLAPIPIIFGGDHATAVPDVLIRDPNIDYMVQGEGEYPFVEFLECFANKEEPVGIKNLWYKKNGEVISNPKRPLYRDLDLLPFPDKSIYDHTFIRDLGFYTITASRGCLYKCTYCGESMNKKIYSDEQGSFWRPRSVDNVIEELSIGKREGRIKCVIFYDALFGANIRWLREFVPKYRDKIGLPFSVSSHPSHLTEDFVAMLKEAGCFKIDLGVQTVDPYTRKHITGRNETNEQVASAIETVMKAGLVLHTEMIFNFPGQTDEYLHKMVRFYSKNRPTTVKIFGLRILPGTTIEQMATDMGVVDKDFAEKNARGEQFGKEFWLGGQWPSDKFFKFQCLLSYATVLPPKVIDYILDKKLYDKLNITLAQLLMLALRTITSEKMEFGKRVVLGRYKHYTKRKLLELVAGQKDSDR